MHNVKILYIKTANFLIDNKVATLISLFQRDFRPVVHKLQLAEGLLFIFIYL